MFSFPKRLAIYGIIFLGIFMFSCATRIEINQEIKPYYNEYLSLVNRFCYKDEYFEPSQIILEINKLEYPTVGQCSVYFNKYIVTVDNTFWHFASEQEKRTLIFHEATHCLFKMNHLQLRNHYMQAYLVNLTKQQLLLQASTLLKSKCNKWRKYGI